MSREDGLLFNVDPITRHAFALTNNTWRRTARSRSLNGGDHLGVHSSSQLTRAWILCSGCTYVLETGDLTFPMALFLIFYPVKISITSVLIQMITSPKQFIGITLLLLISNQQI
ncbi:hypothetical protein ECG_02121 [Echinococcus granulosus]|nr:hypothetical protein ECG_02121 [Echinococcus granulosus]